MKIKILSSFLIFILNTLEEIDLFTDLEFVNDIEVSEFIETLEESIYNLRKLVCSLETAMERNLDILSLLETQNEYDPELEFEFSNEQASKLYFVLGTLNKNLEKLHESKSLSNLTIYERLIRCETLIHQLLLDLEVELS